MVRVGLSDDIGSCEIRAMSLPRSRRMAASLSSVSSVPSNLTEPPAMDAPGGSSRMTDMPVIVFPEPDSPTSPTDSPAATVRLTPSTACTTPALVAISVRRPVTSSRLIGRFPGLSRAGRARPSASRR